MRLTIRNSDGTVSQPMNLDWAAALEKLAAYEDAEDQGRMVILPCKVGERVFQLYQGYIDMVTVQRIRPYIMTEMLSFWPEDFGKTVFLTRKEAEAALKGGHDDGTA